jgi:hypothetical protein
MLIRIHVPPIYHFCQHFISTSLVFWYVHASHAWAGASECVQFSFSSLLNSFKFHSLQAARQMHGREDYQRLPGPIPG